MIALVQSEADAFEDKSTQRVFIGGFSQGCVTSIATWLLTSNNAQGGVKLGGVLAIGGLQALVPDNQGPSLNKEFLSSIPMFLYHGDRDNNLHYLKSLQTYEE